MGGFGVNNDVVVLPSAERTAAETPSEWTNQGANGIVVIVDVSAAGGAAPSITPAVEVQDPASGEWLDILGATALTATGTAYYVIYPSASGTEGAVTKSVSQPLPRDFRINVTHDNTDAITYSVGAFLLV